MFVCLALHPELPTPLIRRLYEWHAKVDIANPKYLNFWKDSQARPSVMRCSHYIPPELEAEFNARLTIRFEP